MTEPNPELKIVSGRSAVVVERHYPHAIDRVWRAVTEPEHLEHWFPSTVEIDLRPGGAMRFPAFAGDPSEHGRVLECEPPYRLRFVWGDDSMTFELSEDGDGTRFVLTHVFDDRAGAASFATGWETCMEGLRAVLRAEEPVYSGPRLKRHESLVHHFGLDQPTVQRGEGGWTVRFERQLTCSAERAWEFFLGRDAGTGEPQPVPAVGERLRVPGADETVLGSVTDVRSAQLLALDIVPGKPGDRLILQFAPGTGHGARLILTIDGSDDAEIEETTAQWGRVIEEIAREAVSLPTAR